MPDLYTDFRALKMAMNDGVLPPMTSVPEAARDVIDPAFVAGLGALQETWAQGLRCPVRGCGEWHHKLGAHITKKHREGPTVDQVKRTLEIPANARLVSVRYRTERRAAIAARPDPARTAVLQTRMRRLNRTRPRAQVERQLATLRAGAATMGARNLIDRCEAQLGAKLRTLAGELGRTPTRDEAGEVYGAGFAGYCKKVFGTWGRAVEHYGFTPNIHPRWTREAVLAALDRFYRQHDRWPTYEEAKYSRDLPHPVSAAKWLEAESWTAALVRAGDVLDVSRPHVSQGQRWRQERPAA